MKCIYCEEEATHTIRGNSMCDECGEAFYKFIIFVFIVIIILFIII